jgi:hypothetical protein
MCEGERGKVGVMEWWRIGVMGIGTPPFPLGLSFVIFDRREKFFF